MKRNSSKRRNKGGHRLGLILTLIILLLIVFAWSYKKTTVKEMAIQDVDEKQYLPTVCLDPGHGGDDDPGAAHGKIVEKEINLTVAKKVGSILSEKGYKVVYSRTSNNTVLDNTARASFCNSQSSDILVSIHHNDYNDSFTDYSSAIYYKEIDIDLAKTVLDSLSTGLGLNNNGLTTIDSNLLAKFDGPAVLTEAFFVSSDYEWEQLEIIGSARLDTEAFALASGIQKYFVSLK